VSNEVITLEPGVVAGSAKELAAHLGLARSTVSMALADNPLINSDTRRRVRAAATRLNYKPNRVARAMRTGKTHVLGVIVPCVRVSFFPDLLDGIEQETKKAGYRLLLCQSQGPEGVFEENVRLLLEHQVEGMLLAPPEHFFGSESYRQLLQQRMPVVLLDHEKEGLAVSSVHNDNRQLGQLATEHLLQLGHRRIAYLKGPDSSENARLRLDGYRRALRTAGIACDERLIAGDDYDFTAGRRAAEEILRQGVPFTAMAAASDMLAIGAMQVLQAKGLRVPEEVSVVGCSNLDMAPLVTPALTTLDAKPAEMAATASRLLLDQIHRGARPVEDIAVTASLIVRASTAKVPKKGG
jgi:DNA-binding LacI/PurR family transcriptional regulator